VNKNQATLVTPTFLRFPGANVLIFIIIFAEKWRFRLRIRLFLDNNDYGNALQENRKLFHRKFVKFAEKMIIILAPDANTINNYFIRNFNIGVLPR
jgi:hypothetical protein